MSIRKMFNTVIPRENAGSSSYSRFEFQIHFCGQLILELFESNVDFTALVDYIDDVVILFENSDIINFYQVKTKKGSLITLNTIIKQEWLSKLEYNIAEFSDYNSSGVFVTNEGVIHNKKKIDSIAKVKLQDALDVFDDPTMKTKILDHVSEVNNKSKDDVQLDDVFLLKTDLSLDDHESHFTGLFQKFASMNIPKASMDSIKTIQTIIINELRTKQKTVYSSPTPTWEEVYNFKGFSSKRLREIIDYTIYSQIPQFTQFYQFSRDILEYHFTLGNPVELKRKYDNYNLEKIATSLDVFKKIIEMIVRNIDKVRESITPDDQILAIKEIILENELIRNSEFYKKYDEIIVIYALYKYYNNEMGL